MRRVTWCVFFSFLVLFTETSSSQQDSLYDCFPLSVGNQWTYRHLSSRNFLIGDVTWADSGIVLNRIVDKIVTTDSIRWLFVENRTVKHCIDYYFPPQSDTCYQLIDSTRFELIELHQGQHRIYTYGHYGLSQIEEFPYYYNLSDSIYIYRYNSVDSLGTHSFKINSRSSCLKLDISLEKNIGETRLKSATSDYCIGVVYFADHYLLDFLILNVYETTSQTFPERFDLFQNFPNPFNSSTAIHFSIPYRAFVTLKMYNTLGEAVSTLLSTEMQVGQYSIQWNAKNQPSGVYYCRLQTGNFIRAVKLLLLR